MPSKTEEKRRDADKFGLLPIPAKADLINRNSRKNVFQFLESLMVGEAEPENIVVLENGIQLAKKKAEHIEEESRKLTFEISNQRDGSICLDFYVEREETLTEYHARLYAIHLDEKKVDRSVDRILKKEIRKTKELIEGNSEFEKAIAEFIELRKSKTDASTNDN